MSGDLVAFLRARLDEDEQIAREATIGPWRAVTDEFGAAINGPDALRDGGMAADRSGRIQVMRPLVVVPPDVDYGLVVAFGDARHIVRHDPARVLAEVEAKRRIIDWCDLTEDREIHATAWIICKNIVREMAAVYASHPDYRDEWRPEPWPDTN